jgi:hypothetical protein
MNGLGFLANSMGTSDGFSLEVNQALLKEDDDLLRQIFNQVFRHHHPQVANKMDVIFSLAQVNLNTKLNMFLPNPLHFLLPIDKHLACQLGVPVPS